MICAELERVERGEIDRLMIFMPPRHGKSELASRRFPAWYLGRNPGREIIAASYNSDLARDFGRDVRNIVASPEYQEVFDTALAQDARAADRWATIDGGAYTAAGVGTAVTGRGAHVLLIDDPVKDREEAESETKRESVWNWYTSTAYTRLAPGGAIIVIQTRWHQDDLAGRLLEAEGKGGDRWEKLILPAISEHYEALWPERYPREALERIKANVGPRDWSALYQQSPSPDEGTFFQRGWFKRHSECAPPYHVYGVSDYAVTENGGDYTEHGVFAYGPNGLEQLDWWHGRTHSAEWIERKLDLMEKYKPLCWFGEGGVIQKAVEPMLKQRMRERRIFCRVEWVPSIQDKPTRARAFQARAAMGQVSLLEGDKGERVLTQLLQFPAGKHDDAVDVCGLMGRVIDMAHPAVAKAEALSPTRPRDSYTRNRVEERSWRTV